MQQLLQPLKQFDPFYKVLQTAHHQVLAFSFTVIIHFSPRADISVSSPNRNSCKPLERKPSLAHGPRCERSPTMYQRHKIIIIKKTTVKRKF
jgi:hypothetical protein